MSLYPPQVQAALLFDAKQPLDLDEAARRFLEAEEKNGRQYHAPEINPGLFYRFFGSNDAMVTLELVPGQAKVALFEASLKAPFTQNVTPDARERIGRHRSHVLVSVHHGPISHLPELLKLTSQIGMTLPGHSLEGYRDRLRICGMLSKLVHELGGASLVHWTVTDQLLNGDAFAIIAEAPAPSPLHVHPWLYSPGTDKAGHRLMGIMTFGAAHFLGREIHFLPTAISWAKAYLILLAFMETALKPNGYVIPHDNTFTDADNAFCCRVRHVTAGAKSGGESDSLYELELMMSKAEGFTSKDYVKPIKIFDDREPPPEVVANLRNGGADLVKDWRRQREMAEAAGNTFQVKYDPEVAARRKRPGLLGWLGIGGKD